MAEAKYLVKLTRFIKYEGVGEPKTEGDVELHVDLIGLSLNA